MEELDKTEKQYEVKITRHAEQSMREIGIYIAVDLMEPESFYQTTCIPRQISVEKIV